jgi:aryl-alcohol dehydrogenase-like predicted oxidoreductase
MTVWSPLTGGFLSGKYTRETSVTKEDRLSGFNFIPYDTETGFRLIDEMRVIGKAHATTVAQIALAWLLAKPYVTSVIVGASKISQLEDNLKAADLQLLQGELDKLDELTAPPTLYPNWFTEKTSDPEHNRALGPA